MEPSARGYNLGTLFWWGYKYGDLAFQVGGVSDETVKYGREFCGTSFQERLLKQGPEASKLQTHPLVREGAPHQRNRQSSDRKQKQDWLTD
jgi:hypothetical protein